MLGRRIPMQTAPTRQILIVNELRKYSDPKNPAGIR